MYKKLLYLLVSLLTLSYTQTIYAQGFNPQAKIWGVSPFQDSMWSVDPVNFTIIDRIAPSLAGFTITGMTGMAYDPCGHETYLIMKVSGVSGRVLGKIELNTGVCTQVGNLGDNFSSLTFREDGQLFGVTGNGATVPETLYLIDKTNGTKTLATALGAGADGEVICYNPNDDFIYHWSGNTTVVYEKILSVAPYTATNIPIIGTTNGETFGALYIGGDTILTSNINSSFNYFKTDGTVSSAFGSNPDDLRGLVMPPVFAIEDDTVCARVQAVNIGSAATRGYGIKYIWGDGSVDSVASGNGSHIYNAPGNFNVRVVLYNGTCQDTVWQKTVRVNTTPVVTISGPSGICPGGNVTLAGSTGGTSQWYLNGSAIPSATGNNYTTNTPGSYNMIKTNLNGCSDSAAAPKILVNVNNPTVSLGNDTIQCGGSVDLDAGNAGSTYNWSTGESSQSVSIANSATVSVTVTDNNLCSATDTTVVTINSVPTVSLGNDITQCGGNALLDAANAGSSYNWSTGATSQTISVSSTGNISVTVTDANTCTAADQISVTINALPVVDLGVDINQCGGTVTIDAANAGSTYNWSTGATTQILTVSSTDEISVTVTNSDNCSASDTLGVTINEVPIVDLGFDVEQCGGSVTLDAENAGSSFAWSNGSSSQTITVNSTNTYTVTVTNSSNCSATGGVLVTINAIPSATLSLTNDSICSGNSSVALSGGLPAGGSYFGQNISGGNFTPSTVGSNTVSYAYTDGNGCSDTATANIEVYVCVGIDEFSDASMEIYPNPAIDNVFIQSVYTGMMEFCITDALGRVVTTDSDEFSGSFIKTISVANLADGVYVLSIKREGVTLNKQLLIRQ